MSDSSAMLDRWLPKFIDTANELAAGSLFPAALPVSAGLGNFSPPALKSLDESVAVLWQGQAPQSNMVIEELGMSIMVHVFGSYLGEYVRKNYGGSWCYDPEDGFYLLAAGAPDVSVYPFVVAEQLMEAPSRPRFQEFEATFLQRDKTNPSPGIERGWAKDRKKFKELVRQSAYSMGWQDFEWRGDVIKFARGVHNLASLAKLCAEHEQDQWRTHIDYTLQTMLSVHGSPEEQDAAFDNFDAVKSRIRVSLRPKQYVAMDGGKLLMHAQSPLEGLYAIPVIDHENTISSIPPNVAARWGMSAEQLVSLGVENLLSSNPPSAEATEIEGLQFYLVSAADDSYINAFALALEKIPNVVGAKGCLFAIPRREALIAYPCPDTEFGAALKLLILLVPRMHDEAPKAVSPDIYYFSPESGYHRIFLERADETIKVHIPPELASLMQDPSRELAQHGNVRTQAQAIALAAFSAEEQSVLEMAPLVAFFLVAAADGNVDQKELRALKEALDPKLFSESPVLEAAVIGLIPRIPELSQRMLSGTVNCQSFLVDLRKLIELRLSPTAAMKFKLTLIDFARYIAEASGGKAFGLFGSKISKAERKVLDALTTILGI